MKLPTSRSRRPSRSDLLAALVTALVAYAPLLLTHPGLLAADTKIYLYLDPGRLMASAASMWNPDVGLGEVTHQNIGYLLPMGPWFWLTQHLGVPAWMSERVFEATVVFGAGLGTLRLLRHLGRGATASLAGALLYELSPYILAYIGRDTALLLPWAGLPWLVLLADRALMRGGWRDAASFSLVVALVGSMNATTLIYAGLAPVLWLAYQAATREAPLWRVGAAAAKLAAGSAAVSAWWAAGLAVEAIWGRAILAYTESVQAVASSSSASEVLRGLGYWYFYGSGSAGAWIQPATAYMERPWLIAVGFALPALAIALGVLWRSKARGYFVVALVAGMVLAVGAFPYGDATPLSGAFKAFLSGSRIGMALRSTDRAAPLVLIGLAGLASGGIDALVARRAALGRAAAALLAGLIAANLPSWWAGEAIGTNLLGPDHPPSYVLAAARYLNRGGSATRVLSIPGESFASYTWGTTEDPVLPGLLDRPYVDRQQVPQGGPATVNLLQALDDPMENGSFVPESLAPISRLLGAGDVVVRADLLPPTDGLPHPPIWPEVSKPPPGLSAPVRFGSTSAASPAEARTGAPAVAVLRVGDPRRLVRTEPAARPLLLAGDGAGLMDLASAGLLETRGPILYSASLGPAAVRAAVSEGATLVLTDTNPLAQDHYSSIEGEESYVLQKPRGRPPAPPGGKRAEMFPGAGTSTNTIAELGGVITVSASGYGAPGLYLPEDRPSNAFDAYPQTAWKVAAGVKAAGQWIKVLLAHPVRADHITLLQPQGGHPNRWISSVTLTFDGRHPLTVALGKASRRPPGQVVSFAARTFSRLEVRIDSTDPSRAIPTSSPVGFATIGIPGVVLHETLRLPTDLLAKAGKASASSRLIVLLTRHRVGVGTGRQDPEVDISRSFYLPTSRTFEVGGFAQPLPPEAVRVERGRGPGAGMGGGAAPLGTGAGACRQDLLRIDGKPVAVSVGSSAVPGEAGQHRLYGCGSSASGVTLSAGWHRVETSPGWETGVDINQLVLDSPPEAARPPAAAPAPGLRVLSSGRDSIRVEVGAARSAFWLVLGQSLNAGWQATLASGRSLGTPRLLDGFANGWLVTPGDHGYPTGKAVVIDLRWDPQQLVWPWEAFSAAALGGCLATALWPASLAAAVRRRRRVRTPKAAPWPAGLGGALSHIRIGSSAGAETIRPPEQAKAAAQVPQRANRAEAATRPRRLRGRTGARWARRAACAAVVGALAGSAISPAAGVAFAAAALVATLSAPARLGLGLASALLCLATGGFVVVHQVLAATPAGSSWPHSVAAASPIAWAAVLCLLAFSLSGSPQQRPASPEDPRRSPGARKAQPPPS